MTIFPVPTESVPATIDGYELILQPKRFKSGSVGWFLGGKMEIHGSRVQISCSLVVVGSKPPDELIEIKTVEELSMEDKVHQNVENRRSKRKEGSKSPKPEKVA